MEKILLIRIEELRKMLNKFGQTHSLIDSEVIELSRRLDRLLNQYYKICSYQQ